MELLLSPTIWLPMLALAVLFSLKRWTKTPKSFFISAGWLLLCGGLLFALMGMVIRGSIVPGDYVGWSDREIWMDQAIFTVISGGAAILAGLLCLLRIAK